MSKTKLVEFKNVSISFKNEPFDITPVRNISFDVYEGETLGIVGESGSGKSLTSLSLMSLLAKNGYLTGDSLLFENKDLLTIGEKEIKKIRGNDISMIFQEPMTSLNPVFTIGKQLQEPLIQHTELNKKDRIKVIIDTLNKVGIPRSNEIINEYPHQLSGGMRQRIMICMALLCNPKLLIADEPTTALDVTIQAQILNLLKDISRNSSMSLMLITHDLGVIAEMCDRVVVMYAGEVVETGNVLDIFDRPKHPYTKGLLKSMINSESNQKRLFTIEGKVPQPNEIPEGCIFYDRCPNRMSKCITNKPQTFGIASHSAKCWLLENEVMTND